MAPVPYAKLALSRYIEANEKIDVSRSSYSNRHHGGGQGDPPEIQTS